MPQPSRSFFRKQRQLEARRQEDRKDGPFAFFAFHGYRAMVLFDDPFHHRQAKTSALAELFGRKKRIEDFAYDLFSDAVAGICDDELCHVLILLESDSQAASIRHCVA
jgi:hypothetical protein